MPEPGDLTGERFSEGLIPRMGTGSPTRSARLWRTFFVGVWLVYLIQPLVSAFQGRHGALYQAGVVATIAAFCAAYMLVMLVWERRAARIGLAVLVVLAVVASLAYHGLATWVFVSAAAGFTTSRSPRLAIRAILGATACYCLVALLIHDSMGDFLSGLLPVLLIGLAMAGFRRQITLTHELMAARETVAQLAASEERLRLARDMHDLTGQSLSTITLKSELAARLVSQLPPSAERDRALDQVQQVADVSRQALRDIREALSGYRRPTLAVEAITARGALEAAGIAAHDDTALTTLSGTFDPDAEAALAWCLREGVTNVVRHSGAANCWMRLGRRGSEICLEIRDDGRGVDANGAVVPLPGDAGGSDGAAAGHGLRGMSERLCAVGGRLEIRPGRGGFCLVAMVPSGGAPSARPAQEGTSVSV
jgi:two-component system, NarL family, sensor histidine kinase DesK